MKDGHIGIVTSVKLCHVLVAVTIIAQSVILFNNAVYTLESFGWAFLVIYSSAAVCYMVLPWIAAHSDEFDHIHWTRVALLAFCFWVTVEEHVHAARDFHAPDGLKTIASVFVSDKTAELVALVITVTAILGVMEFLSHLQHHGILLIKHAADTERRQAD